MSAAWEDDNQMHKIDRAFDYWARKEKATIIKSAGNRNNSDNITSPGKGWNVITVGALNENSTAHWADDGIASFSPFEDPVVDDDPPGDRQKPEVVAPGQSIVMIDQGGTWDTGISMQNLANEATEVTIKYYNTDGSHHSTHTVELAAQGRKTYDWDKPTPEFSGSAVVTANNPIAVMVNVLDYRYAEGQADGLSSYSPIPR